MSYVWSKTLRHDIVCVARYDDSLLVLKAQGGVRVLKLDRLVMSIYYKNHSYYKRVPGMSCVSWLCNIHHHWKTFQPIATKTWRPHSLRPGFLYSRLNWFNSVKEKQGVWETSNINFNVLSKKQLDCSDPSVSEEGQCHSENDVEDVHFSYYTRGGHTKICALHNMHFYCY